MCHVTFCVHSHNFTLQRHAFSELSERLQSISNLVIALVFFPGIAQNCKDNSYTYILILILFYARYLISKINLQFFCTMSKKNTSQCVTRKHPGFRTTGETETHTSKKKIQTASYEIKTGSIYLSDVDELRMPDSILLFYIVRSSPSLALHPVFEYHIT